MDNATRDERLTCRLADSWGDALEARRAVEPGNCRTRTFQLKRRTEPGNPASALSRSVRYDADPVEVRRTARIIPELADPASAEVGSAIPPFTRVPFGINNACGRPM
jgi:hypothetical protein